MKYTRYASPRFSSPKPRHENALILASFFFAFVAAYASPMAMSWGLKSADELLGFILFK